MIIALLAVFAALALISFAFGEEAARGTAQAIVIIVIAALAGVAYLVMQGSH